MKIATAETLAKMQRMHFHAQAFFIFENPIILKSSFCFSVFLLMSFFIAYGLHKASDLCSPTQPKSVLLLRFDVI
jgi:hypothetical protein